MIAVRTSLNYRDIYQEDFQGELNVLFNGVDTEFALGMINHLNKHVELYKTTAGGIRFLREHWFSAQNAEQREFIVNRILSWQQGFQADNIVIFNTPGNLSFFEALLTYLQAPVVDEIILSNPEKETALLKAYLIVNQLNTITNHGLQEIGETFPQEKILWTMFYKPFQYADLINRDLLVLWQVETFKAIKLFEYFERDEQTNAILSAFLAKYNCDSWRTYLRATAGMVIPALDTPNIRGNDFIDVDRELYFYDTAVNIISHIGIDPIDANIEEDYLYLRNRPIFQTGKARFQVIFKRFFVEKIFRALYFELKVVNDDQGIMSKSAFRNKIYTSGFSENTLLYTVLNQIFRSAHATIEGNMIESADPHFGGSDFLAADQSSVFIFESKDVLIRKDVKERLFIPELREELRLKFYKDGNSDKAVLQLAKNVKKILEGEYKRFGFDTGKYRMIYPVIVMHSDAFSTPALNHLLIRWFKEACLEAGLSRSQIFRIKPVVLIDITTLTYFHEHFSRKGTHLNELIDQYLKHVSYKLDEQGNPIVSSMEPMLPFSAFISNYLQRVKHIRSSKWLIDVIQPIILSRD